MNQDEYIEKRLDDQINWYSGKSVRNQRKHKVWQVIKILAALLITTLSLWAELKYIPYVIGILGAFIVFIENFIQIFDYKKLWIGYRMTAERLKREKLLFQTKSDPYHATDPFGLLVKRCEKIMEDETSNWEESIDDKDRI